MKVLLPLGMIITVFSAIIGFKVMAYDSEWPPVQDPWNENIDQNPDLVMDEIQVSFNDPNGDLTDWFYHGHIIKHPAGDYMEWPVAMAIGDLEGPDDGDMHLVLNMSQEVVLAGKLDIDWNAKTANFYPLWFYKFPWTTSKPLPNDHHEGMEMRSVCIWDFDGDGENEVAVCGPTEEYKERGLHILKTDPSPPPCPPGCPAPPPLELAYIYPGSPAYPHSYTDFGFHVGICKVLDDSPGSDAPRQICVYLDYYLSVFNLVNNGSGYSLETLFNADAHCENHLTNSLTHYYNITDVDGDGYDEFLLDGVIDFVDRDSSGNWTYTNKDPNYHYAGVQVWRTGQSGTCASTQHMDAIVCANWIPDDEHDGLEVMCAPCSSTYYNPPGVLRESVDICFDDLDCIDYGPNGILGTVIGYNGGGPPDGAPAGHTQQLFGGNWTSTRAGLEAIIIPKGHPSIPLYPQEDVWFMGGYAVDCHHNELVWDGGMFGNCAQDYGQRATGPIGRVVQQIDWDGDYSQDEILNWMRVLYVWRMGEKGDWEPGPEPTFMPDVNQIDDKVLNEVAMEEYWWYWYQGNSGDHIWDWGWPSGTNGAGRYSHYYEKVSEVYPGGCFAKVLGYDVAGDYREEIVNVAYPDSSKKLKISIYYNSDDLDNPWKYRNPRELSAYKLFRNQVKPAPYMYADQPALDRIEITTLKNPLDPEQWGLNPQEQRQLIATAHYSDGHAIPVTEECTWCSDRTDIIDFDPVVKGLAYNPAPYKEGSARITVILGNPDGDHTVSEPSYLYVGSNDEPVVLMAGYMDTYLIENDLGNSLKIEARVVHKDNLPLYVWMNTETGAAWSPPWHSDPIVWLYDDGLHGGDEEAGDGLYHGIVFGAGHPIILSQGEHLRQIQACLKSNTNIRSEPWPFLIKGPQWTNENISGEFDNDAQGDANTPRIAWAGMRGFKDDNIAVFEAKVILPEGDDWEINNVWVTISGLPITNPMEHAGDNLYYKVVNISGLSDGTYIADLYASVKKISTGQFFYSDHWPRIRVHAD